VKVRYWDAYAMIRIAILLCLLYASALAADADTFTARVVSVSDGDTIDATKRQFCVRYVCRLRVARPAVRGIC